MNQLIEVGQTAGKTDIPARASVLRPRGMVFCWMAAAALAYLAFGVEIPERFASWLAGVWRPETLGALLSTAIGMATWVAANRNWAENSDDGALPVPHEIRENAILRDRLGSGLVEASERRQQHLRQSLEIGLVRQLAGVSALAGRLEQRLNAQHRSEALEVARIKELVERTISEARSLAAAAHPPDIETDGLEAALRKMAGAAEKYQVYCRVVQDSCCLAPDAASALQFYRVVQVLVERAIRHGVGHHILVELGAGPESFPTLTVTDRVGDGGQLPQMTASEFCDLQARAHSIGGALQVEESASVLRLTCRLIGKGPKLQD